MAFDPDAYLAGKSTGGGFDPDAYLSGGQAKPRKEFDSELNIGDKLALGAGKVIENMFGRGALDTAASYARPFAQGAADPSVGLAQLVAAPFTDSVNDFVRQKEAEYQATRGEDAGTFDPLRMAGNLAAPANVIAASRVAKILPSAAPTAAAGVKLRRAMNQGGAVGATMGAMAPVAGEDYGSEKALQIGLGYGLGTALPAGVEAAKIGGRFAGDAAAMLSDKSAANRFGRKYIERLTKGDEQELIGALNAPRGPSVAGSPVTTADVIAENAMRTGSVTGRNVARAQSELSRDVDLLAQAKTDQAGARAAAMDRFGTPADIASAEASKGARAAAEYGAAYAQRLNLNQGQQNQLLTLLKNPIVLNAANKVEDTVVSRNARGNPMGATEYLHNIKVALDKMLSRGGDDALDMAQAKEVNNVRKELIDFLKNTNKDYDAARTQFSQRSIPENRMKIGQALKDKLVSSTDDETGKVFANALRDLPKTIKNKAGVQLVDDLNSRMSGFSKADREVIDQVSHEIARNAELSRLIKSTMDQGAGRAMLEQTPQLPKTLTMTGTVLNAILRGLGMNRQPAVNQRIAEILYDPEKMKAVLMSALAKQQASVGGVRAPAAATISMQELMR